MIHRLRLIIAQWQYNERLMDWATFHTPENLKRLEDAADRLVALQKSPSE